MSKKVCDLLESHNISCWISERDIHPGASYPEEITKAIEDCKIVLLIASISMNSSDHIKNEIELAVDKKKIILAIFHNGKMRKEYIARVKIENRAFIRIVSQKDDMKYSIIVQDGETVALYDGKGIVHTNKLSIGSKILVYPWGNATHLGNVINEFVEEK